MALDELFSQREYELPPPVERTLAATTGRLRVVDLGANIGLFGAWLLEPLPRSADPCIRGRSRQRCGPPNGDPGKRPQGALAAR